MEKAFSLLVTNYLQINIHKNDFIAKSSYKIIFSIKNKNFPPHKMYKTFILLSYVPKMSVNGFYIEYVAYVYKYVYFILKFNWNLQRKASLLKTLLKFDI